MLEYNQKIDFVKSNINLLDNNNNAHTVINNMYIETTKVMLNKELNVDYGYINKVISDYNLSLYDYKDNYATLLNFLNNNNITGIEFNLIMNECKTFHYTTDYQKKYSFNDEKLTFTSYINSKVNNDYYSFFNKLRIYQSVISMINHCWNKKYNRHEYYKEFEEIGYLIKYEDFTVLNQKGSLKFTFNNFNDYNLFRETYKLVTKYLSGLLEDK